MSPKQKIYSLRITAVFVSYLYIFYICMYVSLISKKDDVIIHKRYKIVYMNIYKILLLQ